MGKRIEEAILAYVEQYGKSHNVINIWRTPSVKFADANHAGFQQLKSIVSRWHSMPTDILSGAKSVICYFLPFSDLINKENIKGRIASAGWAKAYLVTSALSSELNLHIVGVLKSFGFRATVPGGNWSQRHVARLAGHGTFGLNNMLITEYGCSGRFYSVVTDMPLEAGDIIPDERCLHKRGESCAVCAKRCPGDALSTKRYDRGRCANMCAQTARVHAWADVCGKCLVGVPCAMQAPETSSNISDATGSP